MSRTVDPHPEEVVGLDRLRHPGRTSAAPTGMQRNQPERDDPMFWADKHSPDL